MSTDPTGWDVVKKYYSRQVCLCSSRDGVPWGMVNDTCQQNRFSLRFDWHQFWPTSVPSIFEINFFILLLFSWCWIVILCLHHVVFLRSVFLVFFVIFFSNSFVYFQPCILSFLTNEPNNKERTPGNHTVKFIQESYMPKNSDYFSQVTSRHTCHHRILLYVALCIKMKKNYQCRISALFYCSCFEIVSHTKKSMQHVDPKCFFFSVSCHNQRGSEG